MVFFQCSLGSNYEPGERSSGGGGGGGGSRTSIKREKDTMTKEVLDHLLRDDVSNINSGGGACRDVFRVSQGPL